ncbi:hypothetical protein YQE_03746, partial [Dendroctonus ponderosae]
MLYALPEEEAYVTILSTCPCERDVHYVITTDGRITDWAPRGHEQIVPLDRPSMEPGPTCKLHFSEVSISQGFVK